MSTISHRDRESQNLTPQIVRDAMVQNDIIKHGLELQAKFNTMCAFEYLNFRGINIDILTELLLPAMRANSESRNF